MKHYNIVYIELDEDTKKEFKSRCAEVGVTMSSVLKSAVAEFLRTHQRKPEKKSGVV